MAHLSIRAHIIPMKGGDDMRYAVLGGDMRFAHLVSMLRERSREATGFFQDKAGGQRLALKELNKYDCILSNWPMKWPLSCEDTSMEQIMENIAPGSVLLLCGPKFPQTRRWDLQYINLWEDEVLLQENAWLTAQGAVESAAGRIGQSLSGSKCMVVGYGRIGRALTEILLGLGAQVTVVSSSENKRREVRESGGEAVSMMELVSAISDKQVIFSTPPAMFIDRTALGFVNQGTLIIDLASPPYGVDLKAAQELGLNALREPGLPGRYCPMSAARAIYNAVLRWEEAQEDE